MRILYFIASLALFLQACTATNPDASGLTRWQGRSINDVTQRWGTPTAITNAPNHTTYYTYVTQRNLEPTLPAPSVGVNVSNRARPVVVVTPPSPALPNRILTCVTTFETDARGVILSATERGSHCEF